jgi:hypothetical protein
MAKNFWAIAGSVVLVAVMWLWVQDIAIPHQQAESAVRRVPRGNLSDLYPRWLGARELLLHGRNPYSAEITREIQQGYYGRPLDLGRANDPRDQQAFAYPLYVVFVLAPTVELPFPVVRQVFLWLLAALTAASVPLWLRAIGWRISLTAQLLWIVLTLGCFPAIQGLKLQQLTLLVAALLAASLGALARGHFVSAGILLALASIKPQLVALPIAWLCIWVAGNWRMRQRLLWSFGLSMLVLGGGSEFLLPGWVGEFRRAAADYWRYTGGGRSVLDVALTPPWGRLLSAALVGAMLVMLWPQRRAAQGTPEFKWSLGLVVATTLAVIPMFAPYNQLLLLPALMVIVQGISRLWRAGRLLKFFLALAVSAVLWPWLASAALVIALLFLPPAVVERAWAVPLYTNFAIPMTVLGALLAGGGVMRQAEGAAAVLAADKGCGRNLREGAARE